MCVCVFASTLDVSFLVVSLHYTLSISPFIPFHVFATFLHVSPFPHFPFPFSICLSFTFCVEVILEHTGVLLLHDLRGRPFDIWKHVHGLNESHESRFEKRNELGYHE